MKYFNCETLQHRITVSLGIAYDDSYARKSKSFVFQSFSIERIKEKDIAYWAFALFVLNNHSSILYPEFALFGLSYNGIKKEYYRLNVVIAGVRLGILAEAKS